MDDLPNREEVKVEETKDEGAAYKDKYLRALAEMENLRKRLAQEKQEAISYAIDNMLSDFLMPLDQLDNALGYTDNLSNELKNWAQGFKMISAQFKQVLENHGITPYTSLGKKFDPHLHEAVEVVETDKHEPDTIIAEIAKGYMHGKRVLRVALVKVAKEIKKGE